MLRELLAEQGVRLSVCYASQVKARDASVMRLLSDSDVIVNQKALLSRRWLTRLKSLDKPIVFDLDDAVWTRPGKPYGWLTSRRVARRLSGWARSADCVTTASEYLAQRMIGFGARKTRVVPMALDDADPTPSATRPARTDRIRVGWLGAPGNLPGLISLSTTLRSVMRARPEAELAVFCGERPELDCEFDWVEYRKGGDKAFAASLDIGLLPLPDDEYSLGKSPIKALLYMRGGAAVIGNFVGASNDICGGGRGLAAHGPGEWEAGLLELIDDESARRTIAEKGRCFVQRAHQARAVARSMSQLYRELATRRALPG
jgi:glycosyltransferase involved in cell wall biosynthesis